MYNEYFGFRESPFSLTPNPRFFYVNPVYLEAYANLRYATESKRGFIALTGEVGTGKTTLLRKLMNDLGSTTRSAFLFNTNLTFEELLEVILLDLGVPVRSKTRVAMLSELNAYLLEQLGENRTVCLLIDEAQNLSDEALEGVRLLSNFETDRQKLLQIVLMGQPELKAKLDRPNLRQLKQRIAMHCEITPLDRKEVGAYIDFRLRAAGYTGDDLFDAKAVSDIAILSEGIPRLINVLCDNALLIAFAASRRKVTADMVQEAARDLRLHQDVPADAGRNGGETQERKSAHAAAEPPANRTSHPFNLRAAVTAAALLVAAAGIVLLSLGDRLSLFTPGGAPIELAAPENNDSRRFLPRQEIVSQQAQAETATKAEPRKPEIAPRPDTPKRLIVSYGSTAYEIAIAAYGADATLGMDLIKEFNPRITNLNWIAAGQEIVLPPLNEEALARQQADGSYRLIVGSFSSRREADEFARRVQKAGHRVVVTPMRVSNDMILQRLEIEGISSLEHAVAVLETARNEGWIGR